jgi:hypothetical protein
MSCSFPWHILINERDMSSDPPFRFISKREKIDEGVGLNTVSLLMVNLIT